MLDSIIMKEKFQGKEQPGTISETAHPMGGSMLLAGLLIEEIKQGCSIPPLHILSECLLLISTSLVS